ncbi:MAG: hypothetical protein MJZ21_03835 [archaeon]|nr:hypothetical protein [archaeon]
MDGTIFEILMLLCFAASWPFNIRKSYKSRTALGKSIAFEIIIEIGYFCGIAAKFLNDKVDFVIAFYVLDICLVATDMVLYFRNRKLDRLRAEQN